MREKLFVVQANLVCGTMGIFGQSQSRTSSTNGMSWSIVVCVLVILSDPRYSTTTGFTLVRPCCTSSSLPHRQVHPTTTTTTTTRLAASNDNDKTQTVDNLLNLVQDPQQNDTAIRESILQLSRSSSNDENLLSTKEQEQARSSSAALFEPLLGNYNVSCTLPNEPSERPVGGKWNSGLFSIQQTWQNLVPVAATNNSNTSSSATKPVAQAVNVIVLKAFFLWTIHVILRGDAYRMSAHEREQVAQERKTPGGWLSPRCVRANFDPPRIVVSTASKPFLSLSPPRIVVTTAASRPFLSLSLGPKSSVVLDTTYCDDRLRLGMGSKGSRFVFVRSDDDPRADQWRELLVSIQPVGKRLLVAFFGSLSMAWGLAAWKWSGIARWISLVLCLGSIPITLAVGRSTGGIEDDRSQDEKANISKEVAST